MVTQPAYTAEIAWDTALAGVLTVGSSTVGGGDVIAGSFGNNVFNDVTSSLKAFSVSRGRGEDMGQVQQGTCRMVLHDPAGTYNPENPASPLAGLITDMRPVRIRATHLGTTYGVFYGFVVRVEHNPALDVRETLIDAVDLFEWVAVTTPTIAATGPTTVGAAIGLILAAVGWTDPAMRALAAGGSIPGFSADGTKTGLALIGDLLAVDLGLFFIDGRGIATYIGRDRLYGVPTPVDTFSASVLADLRPSMDGRSVVNRQTVTRAGGVAQTATNNASRTIRGYRDGSAITSAYLSTDSQAANLAAFVVLLRGSPIPPTRQMAIPSVEDALVVTQLSREVGDAVTINAPGSANTVGTLQSLRHAFDAAVGITRSVFVSTRRSLYVLTVGTSTVGGSDVVGY